MSPSLLDITANSSPLLVIAQIIAKAVYAYSIVVLIAVVVSWLRVDPSNPIVSMIRQVTDPPMNWIKKVLPFVVIGGLDLSPIVLLFGLQFLSRAISRFALTLA